MAEKRENIRHSENLGTVGMILQPFLIYYIIRFITVIMLTYLVTITVQKAGGAVEALFTEQEATVNAIIGGIAMLAGILPLLLDFRREIKKHNKRNDRKAIDAGMVRTLFRILITVTLAFTSSIAINILFISLHLTENSASYSQVAAHQYGVFFPIGLFLYGVVSPLAEEVVFRGILYNRMKKTLPAALSLVLSALLFGLYHGNIVQAAYGFLMGMLIAYTYEKCGDFLFAFLFHAAANISVYVITGSPVLYERFITWQNGIFLAAISVMLLLLLHFRDSFRR